MAKGKIIKTGDEGTISPMKNGEVDIQYFQMYSKEIGLQEGSIVKYEEYTDPKVGTVAIDVQLFNKGKIIKDGDNGMLTDANFGEIPYYQKCAAEQGIAIGVEVRYTLLRTETGMVAIYLTVKP